MGLLSAVTRANWAVVMIASAALWSYVRLLRRGGAMNSIIVSGGSESRGSQQIISRQSLVELVACLAICAAIAVGLQIDESQGVSPAIVLAGKLSLVPCVAIALVAARRDRFAEGVKNAAMIAIGVIGCAVIYGAIA